MDLPGQKRPVRDHHLPLRAANEAEQVGTPTRQPEASVLLQPIRIKKLENGKLK
jgi:hypothetical protein